MSYCSHLNCMTSCARGFYFFLNTARSTRERKKLGGFSVYVARKHNVYQALEPTLTFAQIHRKLSEEWKRLDAKTKKSYADEGAKLWLQNTYETPFSETTAPRGSKCEHCKRAHKVCLGGTPCTRCKMFDRECIRPNTTV